jgi:hypothetical protein
MGTFAQLMREDIPVSKDSNGLAVNTRYEHMADFNIVGKNIGSGPHAIRQ